MTELQVGQTYRDFANEHTFEVTKIEEDRVWYVVTGEAEPRFEPIGDVETFLGDLVVEVDRE